MENIRIDINIGQKIFDNVPDSLKPEWAGLVLSRFDSYLETVPQEIVTLYEIIRNPQKWKESHAQFTKIRKLSLQNDNSEFEIYLSLSECVAKVTYNATGLPAPFDADSGFYISQLALKFADTLTDKFLTQEVKNTILIFNRKNLNNKHLSVARDLIIQKKIDDILWHDWDPIGINYYGPRDEYSGYVTNIFNLKKEGADRIRIGNRLLELETNSIGLSGNLDKCLNIADKIIAL